MHKNSKYSNSVLVLWSKNKLAPLETNFGNRYLPFVEIFSGTALMQIAAGMKLYLPIMGMAHFFKGNLDLQTICWKLQV